MTNQAIPAAVSRLRASKELSEQLPRLGILDMLAVPRNVDELEMQIIDWHDCRMFFPVEGMPRAYMEVPVVLPGNSNPALWGDDQVMYQRWVYSVIGIAMRATRPKAEALLCEHLWKIFIGLRKQYDVLYPDQDPILVWRRHTEITQEGHKGPHPCFEHGKKRCRECTAPRTKVSLRIHIPGLDLTQVAVPDTTAYPYLPVAL